MNPHDNDGTVTMAMLQAMVMQYFGATTDECVDALMQSFGLNEHEVYQEPQWIRQPLRPKTPQEATQNYLDTRNTDRRWMR